MVRIDEPDVIEEELVAARRAELAALLEKDPDLGSGAVVVVGENFDDHRHFVRRITFEHDVLHHELVVADARAFFDRALDDVTRDAGLARLFDDGCQPRVPGQLRPAQLRRDHDFFHELPYGLAFPQPGDFSFRMQPLATHELGLTVATQLSKRAPLL